MKPSLPRDDDYFSWTRHVRQKMRQYGLSAARLRRVMRFPDRTEKGIVPETIAVMQRTRGKRPTEIWVMFQKKTLLRQRTILYRKKIISAWRYPGISPPGQSLPIPDSIKEELLNYLSPSVKTGR